MAMGDQHINNPYLPFPSNNQIKSNFLFFLNFKLDYDTARLIREVAYTKIDGCSFIWRIVGV
jgi:hypothetical protein